MIERAAQGADRLPALVARGRRVREVLKRTDHGVFDTVGDRDALAILEDQNRARLPELVPVRMGRLAQSPFAFYQEYVEVCGALLARAHSQSPAAAAITGYLGKSDRFDRAVTRWAIACADHTERDHAALRAAIKSGRIAAEQGV